MNAMRLAYVSLLVHHEFSIARRLDKAAELAALLDPPMDYFWLTGPHGPPPESYPHLRIIRLPHDNRPRLRLAQCLELNRLTRRYDRVVMRYPYMDPVIYFSVRRKGKLFLEHHTKELEEMTVAGDFRAVFERHLGGRFIKAAGGIIGVTPEIARYEAERAHFTGPVQFIPNAIHLPWYGAPAAPVFPGGGGPLEMVMVSSSFRVWHGLELLLGTVGQHPEEVILHLVGRVEEGLPVPANVRCHGVLGRDALTALYQRVHVGISSLNEGVLSLTQATPLKVREYLACGLPVVTGHADPAFPADFPYLLSVQRFSVEAVRRFVQEVALVRRVDIREAARPYMDAAVMLRRLHRFCLTGGD